MNKKEFINKYYDMFDVYGKGGITFDELVAELMLEENIIDIKEYHEILEGLVPKLGHPKLVEFNTKYKAILDHYRNKKCSIQDVLDAVEILEKYNF